MALRGIGFLRSSKKLVPVNAHHITCDKYALEKLAAASLVLPVDARSLRLFCTVKDDCPRQLCNYLSPGLMSSKEAYKEQSA